MPTTSLCHETNVTLMAPTLAPTPRDLKINNSLSSQSLGVVGRRPLGTLAVSMSLGIDRRRSMPRSDFGSHAIRSERSPEPVATSMPLAEFFDGGVQVVEPTYVRRRPTTGFT